MTRETGGVAVLDQYNDRLPPSTPSFGAELSMQRRDAVDTAARRHALALGLGGEAAGGGRVGTQVLRLPSLGLRTLATDRLRRAVMSACIEALAARLSPSRFEDDARGLRATDLSADALYRAALRNAEAVFAAA
jgi:hypothetical protein